MLVDVREPEDIKRLTELKGVFTVFIQNDNVPAITSNAADANVENYDYDYTIQNNGTLEEYEDNIKLFMEHFNLRPFYIWGNSRRNEKWQKMIMKRDGRTKLYDQRRIINAIHAAYLEYCAAKDEYVQVDMGACLSSIFTRIDNLDEDPINVETIQDIVVEELYKTNYELAECYNDYRIKRSVYRNSKNELIDAVAGFIRLY